MLLYTAIGAEGPRVAACRLGLVELLGWARMVFLRTTCLLVQALVAVVAAVLDWLARLGSQLPRLAAQQA